MRVLAHGGRGVDAELAVGRLGVVADRSDWGATRAADGDGGMHVLGSALVAGATVNGPGHESPPSRENTRRILEQLELQLAANIATA